MPKTKFHKLRLQFSLGYCRLRNSWAKWWGTKVGTLRLSKRGLLGIYVVVMALICSFMIHRFQVRLSRNLEDLSFVQQQDTTDPTDSNFLPETVWEERQQQPTSQPEVVTDDGESQEPSDTVVDLDVEEADPVTAAIAQSAAPAELNLPVADAAVQNDYALSAKWATLGDWRPHLAVDFKAESGAAVLAAAGGTVSKITFADPYWGTIVSIDHGGGWTTTYSNVDNPVVAVGERVAVRQEIGQITENPPLEMSDSLHLHFTLLQNGQPSDPSGLWHR